MGRRQPAASDWREVSRQRGPTGDSGRQLETPGGYERQCEAAGDNGRSWEHNRRQRETTGGNGRQREAAEGNGSVEAIKMPREAAADNGV